MTAVPTPAKRTTRRGRPSRAERETVARVDPRIALQDAAEQLFAQHGFDAVSVRAVASKAGVDPALLHYYFGTKRELFDAVLVRRLDILRDDRIRALEDYAQAAGDALTVEGCFEAYLAPVLWWSIHGGQGWKHYFALMGQLNNAPLTGEAPVGDYIDPVVPRLIELLRRALPQAREEDLYWCYQFLSGALTLALSETGRIDIISGGLCRSSDIDAVRKRLAAYAAAGLSEVCRRGDDRPTLPARPNARRPAP
jgi:AcrR family transcriptional regulator